MSPHPASARARFLASYRTGGGWMLVAANNGITHTHTHTSTARRIVDAGCVELLSRGGARSSNVKCTPEIEAALEEYLGENCTYTLNVMRDMVRFDFGVELSTSTISNKLIGKLYTTKNVRVEPMTCNNAANKAKRMEFAKELHKHMDAGDIIVYYDETNYNVYCKRSQGRAKKGERATVVLPPSKGANLQRGSICMDVNADFVNEIYDKVKASPTFQEHFQGKKVVVVLDNAPAHNQTEENDDLVLLRLAPYSPMCNPTEGCFSVFKAKIKVHLALSREELVAARPRGTIAAARMEILEHAAMRCIGCMDLRLVNKMALHCQHAVAAAERMEDMQYST
ncbi:hypothetical protein PC119_g8469 [Phytophthora cactorum]|uniref:Tc1-like transposase DDE domain-containing protein n=1 Tax=Phytophthora cactorum TaxID=29920 RepID=A0A8T1DZ13_9STRA|nr:hypothetical protein PC117_g8768 [Phytophthora cactorum]KAG3024446.1 hypothetical protein PC119_g8469 [Phytophthora cactorum]